MSDDTLRRWVDAGRIAGSLDDTGRRCVDGAELAALAKEIAEGDALGRAAVPPAITSRGWSPASSPTPS
ncbi:MerR family transcriptional regulator [Tessaracoccus coleopterorum]|uniref:hypothetical protein n=1 Tax=Tessaracoccus coleopterorum TaxID=2714950 RepID=UPI001E47EF6F|nr:hypothetical protein [Tessaracoccus coleopterorum]